MIWFFFQLSQVLNSFLNKFNRTFLCVGFDNTIIIILRIFMLIEHNFGAKKVFGGTAEFKPPILRSSQNDILPMSIC